MQGLSFASIKKHPSLIPLYVCLATGSAMAVLYTMRLAFKNPDVMWNRTKDPNDDYKTKQYKFYNQHVDWSTYQSPAPEYAKKDE